MYISRPMLRRWWEKYSAQGLDGLNPQSEYPLKFLDTQVNTELEALIFEMCSARNIGTRRLMELM